MGKFYYLKDMVEPDKHGGKIVPLSKATLYRKVAVRCAEDACGLFVAMRCVGESEFHSVWDCLKESLFVGSLTLEGW